MLDVWLLFVFLHKCHYNYNCITETGSRNRNLMKINRDGRNNAGQIY